MPVKSHKSPIIQTAPKSVPANHAFRFPTPFGPMAIAWRAEKIVATHLPEKNLAQLLLGLKKRLKISALSWNDSPPPFVRETAQRIQRHLSGEAQEFPLDLLCSEQVSPFFWKVYKAANRIPSGQVKTYGEIAKAAGSPLASRAVGQALARNPFPMIVPCHRVVGSTRKLVGFTAHGGVATKASLLEMESVAHARTSHHQS